ncbi:MAG: M81 family metallopeptidase [Acidobacteriia bacterium]|nr:M81 family metallopeptidase [Terriglobia bacterium]
MVQRLLLLFLLLSASALHAKFRVAIGGFKHESNSFNPAKTTLADYTIQEAGKMTEDPLDLWGRSSSDVAGFIAGGKEQGFELLPALHADATPKGPLTADTYNTITARLIAKFKSLGKIDGILLALHGAMVVEGHPHGDEETMRRMRKAFGDQLPIIVVHDYHANISPETVKLATVLITYKQVPHLDTKERGIQAARIMNGILSGKVKVTKAVVKPPMIYNIIFHNTYQNPFLPIAQATIELEKNPKVLAASANGGYQYGDVPWTGPAVVVATNNDQALADREAKRIADMIWNVRDQLKLNIPSPAQAVKSAMAAPKFPIALMDTGDNIGGGSAGDSTFILDELIKQKATGWVFVIADPAAVKAAVKAGIGGTFDMAVGGKTDNMHGKPVRIRGRVKSMHDGNYIETEVRHGGARYHELGLAVVIEAEGSTRDLPNILLLTTERSSPNSLNQLISCGIYPHRMKILVAKGTIAPRAAYEPVAAQIVYVDSPGATAVNPARFQYKLARPGLFGIK